MFIVFSFLEESGLERRLVYSAFMMVNTARQPEIPDYSVVFFRDTFKPVFPLLRYVGDCGWCSARNWSANMGTNHSRIASDTATGSQFPTMTILVSRGRCLDPVPLV